MERGARLCHGCFPANGPLYRCPSSPRPLFPHPLLPSPSSQCSDTIGNFVGWGAQAIPNQRFLIFDILFLFFVFGFLFFLLLIRVFERLVARGSTQGVGSGQVGTPRRGVFLSICGRKRQIILGLKPQQWVRVAPLGGWVGWTPLGSQPLPSPQV